MITRVIYAVWQKLNDRRIIKIQKSQDVSLHPPEIIPVNNLKEILFVNQFFNFFFFSFFCLCLGLEICLVGALGIQKVGDLLPPPPFAVYVQGTHLKDWLEMRTEGIAPPRCVRIN